MRNLALTLTMAFVFAASGHARELLGWHPNVKQGLEKAKKEGKNLLVFLTNDINGKVVKEAIDSDEFKAEAKDLVIASVDMSFNDGAGNVNHDLLKKYTYDVDVFVPMGLLLDPDGRQIFQFPMDPTSFNPNYTVGGNVVRFVVTGRAYEAIRRYWLLRTRLCETDEDRATCLENMFQNLNGAIIVGYEKELEAISKSHPNEQSRHISGLCRSICDLKTQMVGAEYRTALASCGRLLQEKDKVPPYMVQYVLLTQALAKYELFKAGQGENYLQECYDDLMACFTLLESPLSQRAGEHMIEIKKLLKKKAP